VWEVIERTGKKESIKKFDSYGQAFAHYETEAARINAVNEKGEYTLPNTRISLRKEPVE
jgi:hypothetical protein